MNFSVMIRCLIEKVCRPKPGGEELRLKGEKERKNERSTSTSFASVTTTTATEIDASGMSASDSILSAATVNDTNKILSASDSTLSTDTVNDTIETLLTSSVNDTIKVFEFVEKTDNKYMQIVGMMEPLLDFVEKVDDKYKQIVKIIGEHTQMITKLSEDRTNNFVTNLGSKFSDRYPERCAPHQALQTPIA